MRHLNRRDIVGQLTSMGSLLVLGGVRPLVALAQSPTPAVESRSGIVVAVDRNQVFLNSAGGGLTLKMTSAVRIWKGEDGAPLSAIRPGDDLALRGVMDTDGTFVPSEVWVNITALDGMITKLDGSTATIDLVRNDSVRQKKVVKITDKTLTDRDGPFKKEYLQVGRVVRVIGLALEDGTIQATRVTVYVNGKPVGSEGSKVIDMLTGKIVDRR